MLRTTWTSFRSLLGPAEVALLVGVGLIVAAFWPDVGVRTLAVPGALCVWLALGRK